MTSPSYIPTSPKYNPFIAYGFDLNDKLIEFDRYMCLSTFSYAFMESFYDFFSHVTFKDNKFFITCPSDNFDRFYNF